MANADPIYKIDSNGTVANFLASNSLYATCATNATTAAKIAKLVDTNVTSLSNIKAGMILFVNFTYTNTVSTPTLTLQTNGGTQLLAAKSIRLYGTTSIGRTPQQSWRAGAVVCFVYDGTNWVESYGIENNPAVVAVDGITLSGGLITRYCECSTAAATAAKSAVILPASNQTCSPYYDDSGNGWTGVAVYVYFQYANTASTPNLTVADVNGTEHIDNLPIYFQGAQITTGDEKELIKGVCLFVCDGAHWHLIGGGGGSSSGGANIYAASKVLYIVTNNSIPSGDNTQY